MNQTNSKSNFLNYEIGVVRQFGLSDVHLAGLSGDWAAPEDQHIWNDGPSVSLTLQVFEPVTDTLALHFEGRPFLSGNLLHQDVIVHANGRLLGSWRMRESKPYEFSAEISPEFCLLPRITVCLN